MSQVSHATAHAFVRKVSGNVDRIAQSCRLLVAASNLVDNEVADREGTEMVLHANQIVACSEELLKLVSELKLARLLMDWQKQDAYIAAEKKRLEEAEKQDREKLKRIAGEVRDLLDEIDLHRNESRAKRIKSI